MGFHIVKRDNCPLWKRCCLYLGAVLLAVLSLLSVLCLPTAVSAEAVATPKAVAQSEELFYFGRSALEGMDNGEALCYAYDKLTEGCETVSDYVDISHDTYRINQSEASLVYRTVMADHPEFFWLADGISMSGTSKRISAFAPYVYNGIEDYRTALNQRVAELTADLAGKSEAEISRILHDRMCDITVYRFNSFDQSAIGSLLYGQAVCAGYARGYQMLMQSMGIPCFYVTGHSRDQAHGWNLVQLDGEWYYTDVTWDDQNDNGGKIYYAYLNLTYDWISEDHTADTFADVLPRSTATAANYHYQNGSMLESWDTDRLASLYTDGAPIRIFVTGDRNAFASTIGANLGALLERIACPYSGYSCSTSYMGREIWLTLTLTNPHQFSVQEVSRPTCTSPGSNRYTCSSCKNTYVRDVAPLGHDYREDWWYDETHHGHACSRCESIGGYEAHDSANPCGVCGYATAPTILPGDANGDGKLNNRDLGLLQRYLNGFSVTIDATAADLNSDGKLNNRDLALLQKMLNQ